MKHFFYILILIGLVMTSCDSSKQKDKSSKEEVQDTTSIVEELPASVAIKVGKGPDAMFLTPDSKKLFIANVEDTNISVIDTDKDEVVNTIQGIRYPWGFSRLGTSNLVAVSGWDKQVVIIDFMTSEIVREVSFESHLGGITSDKSGKFLYVIAIDEKQVMKIGVSSLTKLDSYATGNAPDGIGISKDNKKLYVTNTSDGTISIISMKSKTSRLIETGGKPELVHPSHDNSLLYISNFKENKMHIIDTETDEIVKNIEGLNGPEEGVPNEKEDRLYVVNFKLAKVYEYEIPGYAKLDNEYETGGKPIGVMPVNNKLYVTNFADNTVSVIKK